MAKEEFEQARAARRKVDIIMPGHWDTIKDWLSVVTQSEVRFLPVIRRFLFTEGEFVQQGEPIVEIENNEYRGSSVGNLVAPVTGIIRKFHTEKSSKAVKLENIGHKQDRPNYGKIFVTIELEEIADYDSEKVSRRLVENLVKQGRKGRGKCIREQIGNLVFATLVLLALSVGIFGLISEGGWYLLIALAWLPLIAIYLFLVSGPLKLLQIALKFEPDRAFR